MNKIEKLFKKISAHDKETLTLSMKELRVNPFMVGVKKIVGSDFYRYRKGNYRIVFHIENREIVIDNIRLRNEKIHKNL